jgi:hypothetical protein
LLIEIITEWFLPQRKSRQSRRHRRASPVSDPWAKAEKPPIAVVGLVRRVLINAYLLAVEGFPVTISRSSTPGGAFCYGIPEFRPFNELIDGGRQTAARRQVQSNLSSARRRRCRTCVTPASGRSRRHRNSRRAS